MTEGREIRASHEEVEAFVSEIKASKSYRSLRRMLQEIVHLGDVPSAEACDACFSCNVPHDFEKEYEEMSSMQRREWNLVVRVAVTTLLIATLLMASPGAAFAQSAVEDEYGDGSNQQVPVGPDDPAYPGLANPEPTQADPSQVPAGPSVPQYSDGGDQQAPVGPEDPANPDVASPAPSSSQADSSQVPVGPSDPAYPGLASQPPETFEQSLAGILTNLNSISQSLAILGQNTAPPVANPNATPPLATTPAPLMIGGGSPGADAPVAMIDPLSAIAGGASALGGGGSPPSSTVGGACTFVNPWCFDAGVIGGTGGSAGGTGYISGLPSKPTGLFDSIIGGISFQHEQNMNRIWMYDDPGDSDNDNRVFTDRDKLDPNE